MWHWTSGSHSNIPKCEKYLKCTLVLPQFTVRSKHPTCLFVYECALACLFTLADPKWKADVKSPPRLPKFSLDCCPVDLNFLLKMFNIPFPLCLFPQTWALSIQSGHFFLPRVPPGGVRVGGWTSPKLSLVCGRWQLREPPIAEGRQHTLGWAGVDPVIQATSEWWQRFIPGFPSHALEGHLLPPVAVLGWNGV